MGSEGDYKILVVDDDRDIREIIMMILEDEGYQVCGLDNGRAVAEMIRTNRPDIVLLDVLLGDSDGRDICNELKSQEVTKDIVVIMVSATHSRPSLNEKGCPADDFISKPFDIRELVDHVKHYAA